MPEGVSNLAVAQPAPSPALRSAYGAGGLGAGAPVHLAKRKMVADESMALNEREAAPASPVQRQVSPAPSGADERADVRDRLKDDAPRAEKRPASEPGRQLVVAASPTDLTSPERLRAAIEARLTASTWRTLPKGTFVLRLHVDASGKVTAVEVVSGAADGGATLGALLKGLTSASKGTSAQAALVITIRLSH
jgi:hypothetical protein